jgi:PPM family protein phosphatase
MPEIEATSFTCQGPRDINEDRVLGPIEVGGGYVAAVADGVGGAPGGGDAAQIAIDAAAKISNVTEDFEGVFAGIVTELKARAEADQSLSKMATTLSIAAIGNDHVRIAHVGDTRVYHIRGPGLVTLSEDQTEIAELLRKGILTRHQALRYPRRNVLTSALSPRSDYQVQTASAELRNGDRLLLVSDGVHGRLTRGQVLNLSLAAGGATQFADALKNEVEKVGPVDNFSAVIIQIVDASRETAAQVGKTELA